MAATPLSSTGAATAGPRGVVCGAASARWHGTSAKEPEAHGKVSARWLGSAVIGWDEAAAAPPDAVFDPASSVSAAQRSDGGAGEPLARGQTSACRPGSAASGARETAADSTWPTLEPPPPPTSCDERWELEGGDSGCEQSSASSTARHALRTSPSSSLSRTTAGAGVSPLPVAPASLEPRGTSSAAARNLRDTIRSSTSRAASSTRAATLPTTALSTTLVPSSRESASTTARSDSSQLSPLTAVVTCGDTTDWTQSFAAATKAGPGDASSSRNTLTTRATRWRRLQDLNAPGASKEAAQALRSSSPPSAEGCGASPQEASARCKWNSTLVTTSCHGAAASPPERAMWVQRKARLNGLVFCPRA
mmetsp:Transcript_112228/g.317197  ORF Transcript_112228/g.317197 Transcript_112228/m.317197 type:complete len:364 (-) Transcript_112228:26-1117(-)